MKQIFNVRLSDAKARIHNASDDQLNSADYEESLIKEFSIELPYLDKNKFSRKIGKENVTLENAPENFPIGPQAEYAIMSLPIMGSFEIFTSSAGYLVDGRKTLLKNNILSYKEFSRQPIIGNDEKINKININAKKVFGQFDKAIEKAKPELDEYNVKLTETIQSEIHGEKQKRKNKSDFEAKLNPFN